MTVTTVVGDVTKPEVQELMEKYILVSLYVDDKRPLPKDQQFYSKETDSEIETIGDKWTDFMISTYKTNTQELLPNQLFRLL